MNIKIIVGSTREGRYSDKIAAWVLEQFEKHQSVTAEIVDLKDFEMPFFDQPVSPLYNQSPYPHEAVIRFTEKIKEGDAFVIVAPEYNHGPTAVLKNAMDWVYHEWNNKPVAFVGYGSVGAARAIEQLRLHSIELQMAPIRNAVHIPGETYFPVYFGKGNADEMFAHAEKQSDAMMEQLIWWSKALKEARG